MAQIEFFGTLEADEWHITACVAGIVVGSIRCSSETERDEVAEVIQHWLRQSTHITEVRRRRPVERLDDGTDIVRWVTLVRGDRLA